MEEKVNFPVSRDVCRTVDDQGADLFLRQLRETQLEVEASSYATHSTKTILLRLRLPSESQKQSFELYSHKTIKHTRAKLSVSTEAKIRRRYLKQ